VYLKLLLLKYLALRGHEFNSAQILAYSKRIRHFGSLSFLVASMVVKRKQKYSDGAQKMLRMFHPENGKRGVVETDGSSACKAQRSGAHLRRGGQWGEKVENCG
jgi:hypothetical protein